MSNPLTGLRVIPIRYRGSSLALGDERSVEAIAASGVYQRAGVPVEVMEPAFPEDLRVEDEPVNLGILGGVIADLVAPARREGRAVLLTGGNCPH